MFAELKSVRQYRRRRKKYNAVGCRRLTSSFLGL